MKNSQISRRKFIQILASFTALFSVGGIAALFTGNDNATTSGYGNKGYGK
jgi:hypothetical protein